MTSISAHNDQTPLVSVVVPVFNAARTIERAVASIIEQDTPVEIILVDDCSEDNSWKLIKSISALYPARFVLLKSDTNCGVSKTRNRGIQRASGQFLAFLDADDIWLPGKLSEQLMRIQNTPEVVLVSCDSLRVRPCGTVLSRSHDFHAPFEGSEAWKELLTHNFIPTPTVLTRTTLVKALGGFNTAMKIGEDLDLWIRIAQQGKIAIVRKVLAHYFDYPNSLMKNEEVDQHELILDMLMPYFNSPQLQQPERDELLASRYIEMSSGLGRYDLKKYFDYLHRAGKLGFDKQRLLKMKIKMILKLGLLHMRVIS